MSDIQLASVDEYSAFDPDNLKIADLQVVLTRRGIKFPKFQKKKIYVDLVRGSDMALKDSSNPPARPMSADRSPPRDKLSQFPPTTVITQTAAELITLLIQMPTSFLNTSTTTIPYPNNFTDPQTVCYNPRGDGNCLSIK